MFQFRAFRLDWKEKIIVEKYLYLTEIDWAGAWVNGGEIPVSLASSYLSNNRGGIMTPDENLIHKSEVPFSSLSETPLLNIKTEGVVKNITIMDCSFDGVKIPNVTNASYYREDGLILSFCNHFSEDTARRLSKKACVKILDIEALKRHIDSQLECEGVMKDCEYTEDHQRNHFLKSQEDKWQDEFRIFWRIQKNVCVDIPIGSADLVWKI